MAFTRPTLKQIVDRIKSDFKSGLSLTTIIRRSFLDVFAKAFGAVSHTLHGHIDYAIKNKFFPNDGDEATVLRWGTLFKLPRNEATYTKLIIDVVGTTGATLLAGTSYVRSDGTEYTVVSETIIAAATTVPVTIIASNPGADTNMENGDTVSLQGTLAGVESSAAVSSTDTEGADQELLEDYRTRVLERMQYPPSGGTANDYIGYAKTVTGVTRVWVLPGHLGEGTVGLAFVEDANDPIIPSAAKVDEVQAAVEALKPISADLYVFAPIELEMNPDIKLKPNTTAVQNAVIAELNDLLSREAQVRGSIDPTQAGMGVVFDGKIKVSQINEAISIAADETDHVLTNISADVQPEVGGIVTLGIPTFSTLA